MRRGELAGLTWRCLDLDGARLSVEQLGPGGGCTFGHPRRPARGARSRWTRRRCAPYASTARRSSSSAPSADDAYVDSDLVFADELGGPLYPRLTEVFVRLRKAAGIPSGTLHVLRHTAATLALTNGIPVHIVAARLGDDPNTVLGTYAHLLPQSDE
jgi:integrase